MPDGRVLIAGSKPHYFYRFSGTEFHTELRIEAFSPEYLLSEKASIRPIILELPEMISYGSGFDVVMTTELPVVGIIEINIASAPFATHYFSQGQRLVKLAVSSAILDGLGSYRIACIAPLDGRVAPSGYYIVFAVNTGVQSAAKWVKLSNL
ncbi:aldehyde oxidase GLOX [Tanacetum coccineum]